MDQASLRGLTPDMRRVVHHWLALVDAAMMEYQGVHVRYRITSVKRTRAQQAALYRRQGAQGLAAPPGRSKHERGRAIDVVFENVDNHTVPAYIWKQLGGKWGGDFRVRDPVHFEDPFNL